MLAAINVTERLHWPESDMATRCVLEQPGSLGQVYVDRWSSGVLRNLFRGYSVVLQNKDEEQKKNKQPPYERIKRARILKSSPRERGPVILLRSGYDDGDNISVSGSPVSLSPQPFNRSHMKLPQLPKTTPKKLSILTTIKPSNVQREKSKFFESGFDYNPQFEYRTPASAQVLERNSRASDRFLLQAVRILEVALQKYGTYEKFEEATGGKVLSRSRIQAHVKKYLEKEGCGGEIVVHLTDDLLSRASMTVMNGKPTLTINTSMAREQWLEGMLRHEIGTHYFRAVNNLQQPWASSAGRKRYDLRPMNPTEEGLASIHSVLLRHDPTLWRAALLYYTVHQAALLPFKELFHQLGRFVNDPVTRWEYCVRAKRGQTDTSEPGCFNKDQVYLDGVLKILRHREQIDFQLLTALGKVSYEDVDRLKDQAMMAHIRIPHFLQDRVRYAELLRKIMEVNQLNDEELRLLI